MEVQLFAVDEIRIYDGACLSGDELYDGFQLQSECHTNNTKTPVLNFKSAKTARKCREK